MKRLLPLLVLLVVGSACSALGAAPAATVNGEDISTDSIEDQLDAIRTNDQYTAELEQAYGSPVEGAGGKGTFGSAFVAQLLALHVYHEVVADDLDERGVEIDDSRLEEIGAGVQDTFDSRFGAGTWEEFPRPYRDLIIRQQAIVATAEQMILDEIGDDEEAFFDANPDEFVEICVSHLLVGLQGGASPSEAQADALAIRERIEEGEDFEALATDESDDPSAAAQQGQLGCGSRSSLQFDPTFEAAAFDLEEGVVSEPVQTQFGSHLILVTERTEPDYEDVEDTVALVMQEVRQRRVNDYFVGVICSSDISVNPRYGTWADASCDEATPQIPRIDPPEGPVGDDEGLQFEL